MDDDAVETDGPEVVEEPSRNPWFRRAFVVGFVLFVGAWTWAFWYEAHRPKPEPLDATAQQATEGACRAAITALKPLPQVGAVPTVESRLTRLHQENAILSRATTALEAVRPSDHSGAEALTGFTTDWKNLITARERYATDLAATGKRPKFVLPVDPTGAPVTIRMREYADIHHLDLCTPDSLQGEVVEGRRVYPRLP